MKTSIHIRTLATVGFMALGWTCLPLANGQTPNPPPDGAQNSKLSDSTADQNKASTGAPGEQAGTLDKTSTKDTANSLDKNPSTASTDSADKAGTKNPDTATTPNASGSAPSTSDKVSDKDFILNASQGGMTEVELGKLAQEKGSSTDVKQFGSHMVMDHSKAITELKSIADQKGVMIPPSLDPKHQAIVDRFQHLSGSAFDHAYVHAMVKDHEKDVAEFRQESSTAEDPKLKTFSENTLQMIETHLSDIKSIQSKIK